MILVLTCSPRLFTSFSMFKSTVASALSVLFHSHSSKFPLLHAASVTWPGFSASPFLLSSLYQCWSTSYVRVASCICSQLLLLKPLSPASLSVSSQLISLSSGSAFSHLILIQVFTFTLCDISGLICSQAIQVSLLPDMILLLCGPPSQT